VRKHVHTRRRSSLWWLQPVISQTLLGGRSSFSEESSKSKGKKQTSKRDNGKAESGCTGCLASGTSLPAAEGRVSPRAARPGLRTARLARSGEGVERQRSARPQPRPAALCPLTWRGLSHQPCWLRRRRWGGCVRRGESEREAGGGRDAG